MGRPKRVEAKTATARPTAPIRLDAGPRWTVAEKLRFWCPVCGMVADVDRLDSAPYPIQLKLQKFGGRLPGTEDRPPVGYMEYVPAGVEEFHGLIRRLAEVAKVLPAHIASEGERGTEEEPETFYEWTVLAQEKYPEIARSRYGAVLYGLSLALNSVGVDVPPEVMSTRFSQPLAKASPSDDFRTIALTMASTLQDSASQLPHLGVLDENAVSAAAWDLVHFEVNSGVEEDYAAQVKKLKLRRGTEMYEKFLRENAKKIVLTERAAFDRAKSERLAQWARERREWDKEAESARNIARRLEEDLDVVVGVYTLAGERIPGALVSLVEETRQKIEEFTDKAEKKLDRAEELARGRAFEEYMAEHKGVITKQAWRYYEQHA